MTTHFGRGIQGYDHGYSLHCFRRTPCNSNHPLEPKPDNSSLLAQGRNFWQEKGNKSVCDDARPHFTIPYILPLSNVSLRISQRKITFFSRMFLVQKRKNLSTLRKVAFIPIFPFYYIFNYKRLKKSKFY